MKPGQGLQENDLDRWITGLFDHAGMFPPAAKSFAEALADSARFDRNLQRPHMVHADMVLALHDLQQLTTEALTEAGFPDRPCRVAVVGVPYDDLGVSATTIARWSQGLGRRVQVDSVEIHFQGATPEIDLDPMRRHVGTAALYVEPKWDNNQWREGCHALAQRLALEGAGLKWRLAGDTAVDHATLATIIDAVAQYRLPSKATQGLHHPTPTDEHPHGFLTLLMALRLRQATGKPFQDHVEPCLQEQDATALRFTDGLHWRGHRALAHMVQDLPPFAIGSCSLEEPDQDLANLYGPPQP